MKTSPFADYILGLREPTLLDSEEMAQNLKIAVYEGVNGICDADVAVFVEKLKLAVKNNGGEVVEYEDIFEYKSNRKIFKRLWKISALNFIYLKERLTKNRTELEFIGPMTSLSLLRRKQLKSGYHVVVPCELNNDDHFPMEHIRSFKHNSVVLVAGKPEHFRSNDSFENHYKRSLQYFSRNMVNIAILVDEASWVLYNFNASHPEFDHGNLEKDILKALVPKLIAPVKPYYLKEFEIRYDETVFERHKEQVDDLVKGATLFSGTNLYPSPVAIDSLPFKNVAHRLIGKIHLDERSGMSYGFLAKQLPQHVDAAVPLDDTDFSDEIRSKLIHERHAVAAGKSYILITHDSEKLVVEVPTVRVLSQRSGSDKTNVNIKSDLVVLGLEMGVMFLEFADRSILKRVRFRPSFDTQVILAHGAGNLILASIFKYLGVNKKFVYTVEKEGLAICHWHGYLNRNKVPEGWYFHGSWNPHVSCSSPQSAVYALEGKIALLDREGVLDNFNAEVHVEPHHGSNVIYPSVYELADMLLTDRDISVLGNKYLE